MGSSLFSLIKLHIFSSLFLPYHIDELNESQSECNLDLLGHVLNWANQFVVASEQISDKALLLLGTEA